MHGVAEAMEAYLSSNNYLLDIWQLSPISFPYVISPNLIDLLLILQFGDPEINTPHPNEKKVMLNTDSGGSKTTLDDIIESNLQTNANRFINDDLFSR